jgi:hypothetical protein
MSKQMIAVLCVALSTVPLGFERPALAQGNPLRDAYFGETHVHTSWSADAWLFGNRLTDPTDGYRYFKGETIKHPLGYDIRSSIFIWFRRLPPACGGERNIL